MDLSLWYSVLSSSSWLFSISPSNVKWFFLFTVTCFWIISFTENLRQHFCPRTGISSMLACLTVYTRNTLWVSPAGSWCTSPPRPPWSWVMGRGTSIRGEPLLGELRSAHVWGPSTRPVYCCPVTTPWTFSFLLFFSYLSFFFFFDGSILFPRFPMSLLRRLGNFTSFFEDVTFTLQSFIGPLNCFLWFLFFWIYCLCQIVFLKSVVNCLLFLRIHVGLCYLQEFFPFRCGKGIGSPVGLSGPGFKSVEANLWSSFTGLLCLII